MIPWRGRRHPCRGASINLISGKGRCRTDLGHAHGGASKNLNSCKSRLTTARVSHGNKPLPGRGASKNLHFMQGPFDDGKGLSSGNKPLPQGRKQKSHVPASKKSHFRRVVCRGQGLDRQEVQSWQGRQQKSPFQAGVVGRGQGLDREHAHSC